VIARIFSADPAKRLEEDLMRLRDALARASEDRDGLQPTSAEVLGYPPRNVGEVR
jgi:hypothetical protein